MTLWGRTLLPYISCKLNREVSAVTRCSLSGGLVQSQRWDQFAPIDFHLLSSPYPSLQAWGKLVLCSGQENGLFLLFLKSTFCLLKEIQRLVHIQSCHDCHYTNTCFLVLRECSICGFYSTYGSLCKIDALHLIMPMVNLEILEDLGSRYMGWVYHLKSKVTTSHLHLNNQFL